MANRDMFVSYAYNTAGNAIPGFGNAVLPAIPDIVELNDVEFWLEKQVGENLVEKFPDLEGVVVAILSWRRMED